MNTAAVAPLTIEDYRQLPEGGPRYQLIEGDLFMAPAPCRYHQEISGNLSFILQAHLEKHPVGKIYTAPFDVFLDEINALQPDLVFVSKANYEVLTDAGVEGAPDLVVEILSPKTAHLDKKPKRRVYARSGVRDLWIIDPELRLIHVYALQKDPERPAATYSEKETFTSALLPGLKIRAARVFRS